jgi:hypothetical protein
LKITTEEKLRLSEWFKPELRRKADQIAERRTLIACELQLAGKSLCDHQNPVSLRYMAKLLVEKHGIKVSHATVLKDFRFLKTQHREVDTPADFTIGKFPLLIDSKPSLVLAEKTFQQRNPPAVRRKKESYQVKPNNLCASTARFEIA